MEKSPKLFHSAVRTKKIISPIAFNKVLSILNTEITDIEVILKRKGRASNPSDLVATRSAFSINDHRKLLPKIAQNAVNEALVGINSGITNTSNLSLQRWIG